MRQLRLFSPSRCPTTIRNLADAASFSNLFFSPEGLQCTSKAARFSFRAQRIGFHLACRDKPVREAGEVEKDGNDDNW